MNNAYPDDVLIALLYYCQGKQKKPQARFTADRVQLHRRFADFKKRYPDVMRSFRFRKRDVFPESEMLDQALVNLEASGLLNRHNLTPRFYYIQNSVAKAYNKFAKDQFAEKELAQIEKMADELADVCR